jgi:hypothetical protein
LLEEKVAQTRLAVDVGVVARVEFADGWEEDAACFAVADAEGAELESVSLVLFWEVVIVESRRGPRTWCPIP